MLMEASLELMAARIILLLIPFSRVAGRLGVFVPPCDPRTRACLADKSAERSEFAAKVCWAVALAVRHAPFELSCLPRAIAARQMLSRRGISSVLYVGVTKGKQRAIDAHAWLNAAGVEVTGYPVVAEFVELGCFVQADQARHSRSLRQSSRMR